MQNFYQGSIQTKQRPSPIYCAENGASFEALEIGMAERMVVRAVADAYTVSERRVERLLATTGDLGTVAEILAAAKRGRAASILYVFDELRNIARIAGKGSQTEKRTRVARLLSGASSIEAKYIIRTILGAHRIGVADMTFLRALAKAYSGSLIKRGGTRTAFSQIRSISSTIRRRNKRQVCGRSTICISPRCANTRASAFDDRPDRSD